MQTQLRLCRNCVHFNKLCMLKNIDRDATYWCDDHEWKTWCDDREWKTPPPPRLILRVCGHALWSVSEGVVLMARIQGGTHIRWTVTRIGQATISISRQHARLFFGRRPPAFLLTSPE